MKALVCEGQGRAVANSIDELTWSCFHIVHSADPFMLSQVVLQFSPKLLHLQVGGNHTTIQKLLCVES